MASAQCQKPSTTVEVCQPQNQHKPKTTLEVCQPKNQHKHNTTLEVCQPKSQHSSFGQKISELTNKAFKGHHSRHGSNQNVQCYSQTQVESHGQNGSKTETHFYGQTQTQHDKKHGVSKTQITVTMVQAQITHTTEDPTLYGTKTTCFGAPHAKKNGELNNKKEMNLFRRIKNGISRHNNNEGGNSSSSSSSDSESDDEKKCPKTKN